MKKIYVLFAVVIAMVASGSGASAQATRYLTWKLTGTQTWPAVSGTVQWTDKANWVITGSAVVPLTDVTNGDYLTIDNGGVINVTANMSIPFNNFAIEVVGASRIDIQSKIIMALTAVNTGFSLKGAQAGQGLTLEKANGGTTTLTLNGIAKALNNSNSTALTLGVTTSSHALGTDAQSQSAGTSGYGGFVLGALPVILTNFDANLSAGNKVVLSWSTSQEENSDHFTVEKSSDGIHWQAVATVKAAGNSSLPIHYTASDATPSTGSNMYRIAMVDLNGKTSYTVIKNVRLNAFGHISLYPNPAADVMNISLGDAPRADWSLAIFNHAGQMVGKYKFGKNTTTASLPVSKYSTGNYVVEISDGTTKQTNSVLISHK